MIKTIFIVGPTATGKTSLAIALCKRFNGEIISADSRQVYKYLDIGTGKDIGQVKNQKSKIKSIINNKERRLVFYEKSGVRIWLYDVVEPREEFSVAHYLKVFKPVYKGIFSRGKTSFVVGGTGFYLSALLNPPETVNVPPDKKLREKLLNLSLKRLQEELKALDREKLEKMNQSDRKNPRRLMRAIEVITSRRDAPPRVSPSPLIDKTTLLIIGLQEDKEILKERVGLRVQARLRQGLLDEIGNLLDKGCRWTDPGLNSLGYREWREYFEKKKSYYETVEIWKADENDYARRQMTWFRKMKNIHWLDVSAPDLLEKASKIIIAAT